MGQPLRRREAGPAGALTGESARVIRRSLAVLLALLPISPRLAADADLPRADIGGGSVKPLRALDLPVRVSLDRAIAHATKKLENPRCREVFSDFRDRMGRTLLENLEASGLDGPAHLRALTFADGWLRSDCRLPSVLALATPGREVIYICGPQFLQRQRLDPGFAAALMIHEQLHALGLGENPPHSQEITARVISRCGR
jgi:hypothetical protein